MPADNGTPKPSHLVEDFSDDTLRIGGQAVLRLADGRSVLTSPIEGCVFDPYARTCSIDTVNSHYTTDFDEHFAWTRALWGWFGDQCGVDGRDRIDAAVDVPGIGKYPAGTERIEIWHDFEDATGIPVHALMFPDEHR